MYVKVITTPNARRKQVKKVADTEFHIAVREPAERNMANMRIRELIAREFEVSPSQVRLISGHHSRSKIISVPET